ncbi:carbohydrate sulfotransferase 11-like [Schistocerca piceifrons]|uniref:carbohydrate sulfotransferase 11-like n=1 Tax=Schistocerca piceifrons TaxID=274613 RepID=UPI001F5EDE02|nr:carbohydrate sulfotransferase 11-like [Schistocerca piceifrons]
MPRMRAHWQPLSQAGLVLPPLRDAGARSTSWQSMRGRPGRWCALLAAAAAALLLLQAALVDQRAGGGADTALRDDEPPFGGPQQMSVLVGPSVSAAVTSRIKKSAHSDDALEEAEWGGAAGGRAELPAWMASVAQRMERRRRHLSDACSALGLDAPGNDSLHRPNPWEFFVNHKHHLVWCNVFKAASTSWMYNFNLLAGYSPKYLQTTKEVPLSLARQRYPRPSLAELRAALNKSVSFLIVRHPLQRLLSAYRDKLENALPHTFHQRMGAQIVRKYRKGPPKIVGTQKKTNPKNPRWPTFSEFVQFLVDEYRKGSQFDMHWTPITEFCTPCQVPFDVIAKFETLEEDQNFLIHLANLQDVIQPQKKNQAKGRTTTEVEDAYFSQLTKAQILLLYNIYRYDFTLFNYTLEGYLELAITETPEATVLDVHATV